MNSAYYVTQPDAALSSDSCLKARKTSFQIGEFLQCALVSFGLFGQGAMILAAAGLNVSSRTFTVPSRALMVGFALSALLALLFRPSRASLNWNLIAFLTFWIAYGGRIVLETATRIDVVSETGRYTIGFISTMAIGACFLPGLAILVNSNWAWHRRTRAVTIILASFTAALMLKFYGSMLMNFENRMKAGQAVGEVTTINSLTLGYLGAALTVFALYSLSCLSSRLVWRAIFSLVLGGVGVFLIVGSASRGPIVSVAVASIVLIVSQTRRFDLKRLIMLSLAFSISIAGLITLVNMTGSIVLGRLMSTGDAIAAGSESASRLDLYQQALGNFADSPLIGKSITLRAEDGTDLYPHNVILESLVATGLLGTVPLLFLLGSGLMSAWRILTRYPGLGWISILFILFLTGAMFGGALFSNAQLWLSLTATLSCDAWLRRNTAYERKFSVA